MNRCAILVAIAFAIFCGGSLFGQVVNDFVYVGVSAGGFPVPPAVSPGTTIALVDGVISRTSVNCLDVKVRTQGYIPPVNRRIYLAVWDASAPLSASAHLFCRTVLSGDWLSNGVSWFATVNPSGTWPMLCYDPSLAGAPIRYQVIVEDIGTPWAVRASYVNLFTL